MHILSLQYISDSVQVMQLGNAKERIQLTAFMAEQYIQAIPFPTGSVLQPGFDKKGK